MQIHIICVGNLKSGSERELFDDYIGRFNQVGSRLGFKPILETEVATSHAEKEAQVLVDKAPDMAANFRLDERGKSYTSIEFAKLIEAIRDGGKRNLSFFIGGASGFGNAMKNFAPNAMSFGTATWPHRLVRVMLAEQLYRASTILLNLPYHKS